jgi:NADH dehydrogenase/NADH:ubiquinone oxidoreductase subunit G
LINFNHPNPELLSYIDIIEFRTDNILGDDRLIFPLAPFSESEGSITNRDGIVQECQKVIHRDNPIPTVRDWINDIMGGESL